MHLAFLALSYSRPFPFYRSLFACSCFFRCIIERKFVLVFNAFVLLDCLCGRSAGQPDAAAEGTVPGPLHPQEHRGRPGHTVHCKGTIQPFNWIVLNHSPAVLCFESTVLAKTDQNGQVRKGSCEPLLSHRFSWQPTACHESIWILKLKYTFLGIWWWICSVKTRGCLLPWSTAGSGCCTHPDQSFRGWSS